MGKLLPVLLLPMAMLMAQEGKLRVIAFGAHPDDCDMGAGGTAAKLAAAGHKVKFVALTNGDAGHESEGGGALAKRRRAEAAEAGRRIGIAEYVTLDNHDGELLPTLQVRQQVIRLIRQWDADVVIAPRPNDYHPDHRYTGMLIQDAAYMVMVPNVCPDTPALRKNPVFLYFEDRFQRPNPFRPDIVIDISDTWEKKMDGLDAHLSQVYDWLPWIDGRLETVPKDPVARRKWLSEDRTVKPTKAVSDMLVKWYGADRAARIMHAEAFELCEYGRQPSESELRNLFPIAK